MHLVWSRTLLAVGAAVLTTAVSACSSGPQFAQNLWPFGEEEATTLQTPSQRIERLKALADGAAGASAADQERTTADLAHQIQRESDPLIREEIIRTIAAYNTPLAAAVVAAGLKDSNSHVRIACCQALGRRRDSGAVTKLGEVLGGDTDIDVRLAAARALGSFRGPEAIGALAVALEDRDPALQYRAVQSLREVSGQNYGQDVAAWREFAKGGTPTPVPAGSVSLADRVGDLWPF